MAAALTRGMRVLIFDTLELTGFAMADGVSEPPKKRWTS